MLGAALLARRWTPEPAHPQIRHWYAGLRKPDFAPPGQVIGPVWGILDVLIAIAGARLIGSADIPARRGALAGWALVVAGLAGWPRVFFGGRAVGGGVGVIGAMLAATLSAIGFARRIDPPSAFALTPLAAWLAFAGLLNGTIWRLNR